MVNFIYIGFKLINLNYHIREKKKISNINTNSK